MSSLLRELTGDGSWLQNFSPRVPLCASSSSSHGNRIFPAVFRLTLLRVSGEFFFVILLFFVLGVRLIHRGGILVHVYTPPGASIFWSFFPLVHGTCHSTLSPTSYPGRARSSIEKKGSSLIAC